MSAPKPLVIVSGPSGSGKTTVIGRLLSDTSLPARLSVSATTRTPRPHERDGREYYFWTRQRFQEEINTGAFIEWAEVHGNYYGTLHREVDPYRENGLVVILDIDVQGARQVRKQYADAVTVFLRTSSMATYEDRLRKRGTETEVSLQRRLATAQSELTHAGDYEHEIINDQLETAVAQLGAIVRGLLER
jgi:guanylate kinase